MTDSEHRLAAVDVQFDGDWLSVVLTNGRRVGVPVSRIPWLAWLASAPESQRNRWTIEPGGFAVYWDDLDDGVEVRHLLEMEPLH